MASIYRAFMEKLGRTAIDDYVGNVGDLFYDPDATPPSLRVSDGVTAGGLAYELVGGSGEYNQDSFRTIQMSNRKLWEDYCSFPGFIHQLISYLKKEIK